MTVPLSAPVAAAAPGPAGPDPARLLGARGLPVPPPGGGLPLARVDGTGRPVTVADMLTAEARAVAAQRGTPLLVVIGSPPGPVDPSVPGVSGAAGGAVGTSNVVGAAAPGRPWPVVVVAASPWALAGADLGLLVGDQGPADHDGLDEAAAADLVRRFLDLCSDSQLARPPADRYPPAGGDAAGPSLIDIVPFAIDGAYDAGSVLAAVVDGGRWVELAAGAAPEVLTAVARIGGRSIGVTVSCPDGNGGRLTPAGCARVERLLDWCERGGRPWVSLVDSAGVNAPAQAASRETLRRAAARARRAEVTKLVVVTGRAVGLAATVLGAVGARADLVLPWPRARFSLTPPPPDLPPSEAARLAAALRAATEGDLLDVIHPDETRPRLIEALDLLRGRRAYGAAPEVAAR